MLAEDKKTLTAAQHNSLVLHPNLVRKSSNFQWNGVLHLWRSGSMLLLLSAVAVLPPGRLLRGPGLLQDLLPGHLWVKRLRFDLQRGFTGLVFRDCCILFRSSQGKCPLTCCTQGVLAR